MLGVLSRNYTHVSGDSVNWTCKISDCCYLSKKRIIATSTTRPVVRVVSLKCIPMCIVCKVCQVKLCQVKLCQVTLWLLASLLDLLDMSVMSL